MPSREMDVIKHVAWVAVATAIVLHALFPRHELRIDRPYIYRIDRWTGSVVVGRASGRGTAWVQQSGSGQE